MAKAKINSIIEFRAKSRKKRPGVHAKTKTAKNKHSKNYVKPYRGQGR